MKKTLLSILVLSALFLTKDADAQILSRGDLFGPGALPPMLSIEGGFGMHTQSGSFLAACQCEFDQQKGNGFLLNLMYELPLDYTWVIGLKGGVDFKKTLGRVEKNENAVVRFEGKQDSLAIANLRFDRNGTISATYAGFAPFVKYQFARLGPFVQLGGAIQFLVASHFTHHREVIAGRMPDGAAVDLRFNNGTKEETLENGEIANARGMRIAAQVTGGYDIELSEHSLLAPMVTYEIPFTTIRDTEATNWKINSLFFSVAVKFRMD